MKQDNQDPKEDKFNKEPGRGKKKFTVPREVNQNEYKFVHRQAEIKFIKKIAPTSTRPGTAYYYSGTYDGQNSFVRCVEIPKKLSASEAALTQPLVRDNKKYLQQLAEIKDSKEFLLLPKCAFLMRFSKKQERVKDKSKKKNASLFYMQVFDYMPLGDLNNYLMKNTVSIQDRYRIAHDVYQGLKIIHSLGLLHRDLKAENVILYTDEFGKLRAKIIDFDFLSPPIKADTVFSLKIMAPENNVCTHPDGTLWNYNTSTDIYAFGVLLRELFTKNLPTEAKEAAAPAIQLANDYCATDPDSRPKLAAMEKIIGCDGDPALEDSDSETDISEVEKPPKPPQETPSLGKYLKNSMGDLFKSTKGSEPSAKSECQIS